MKSSYRGQRPLQICLTLPRTFATTITIFSFIAGWSTDRRADCRWGFCVVLLLLLDLAHLLIQWQSVLHKIFIFLRYSNSMVECFNFSPSFSGFIYYKSTVDIMSYNYVVNIVKQSSHPFWLVGWWLFSHDRRVVPSADWRGGGAHRGWQQIWWRLGICSAFLTEGKNNLLCCLLPAKMVEWFLLMTAETGFMMTALDIPYLELYCVLGHKWCVCCSDGLALALKCLNKYASVISWYWPPSSGLWALTAIY